MNKITRIVNGKIVEVDKHATVVLPVETAARENRQQMRDNHRKDLLQKNNPDYYKAYKEQLDDLDPELRRLLS